MWDAARIVATLETALYCVVLFVLAFWGPTGGFSGVMIFFVPVVWAVLLVRIGGGLVAGEALIGKHDWQFMVVAGAVGLLAAVFFIVAIPPWGFAVAVLFVAANVWAAWLFFREAANRTLDTDARKDGARGSA